MLDEEQENQITEVKYFSKWRKEEGYKSWNRFYEEEVCNGREYEELREEWEREVEEVFWQDCEDNGWTGEMDE